MPARNITTEVWSDPSFARLSPSAQLVFFRLVAGPETTAAGGTRVLPKVLAVDCNLDGEAAASAALAELESAGLVRAYGEWRWLPGWVDHQVNGAGFITAARRAAQARGLPRGLSTAMNRALDRRFGPAPTRTDDTKANGTRTRKMPITREKRGASPEAVATLARGTRELPREDQYQDPLPSGGGGLVAATPAPAPGAQPPQQGDAERQRAGAVALAEATEEVGDRQVAALLARNLERMAAASAELLPDPGPPDPIEDGLTGTIDQELPVGAAGLRRWEEAAIARWQATGDARELRELQRSGSPQAKNAVKRLLESDARVECGGGR